MNPVFVTDLVSAEWHLVNRPGVPLVGVDLARTIPLPSIQAAREFFASREEKLKLEVLRDKVRVGFDNITRVDAKWLTVGVEELIRAVVLDMQPAPELSSAQLAEVRHAWHRDVEKGRGAFVEAEFQKDRADRLQKERNAYRTALLESNRARRYHLEAARDLAQVGADDYNRFRAENKALADVLHDLLDWQVGWRDGRPPMRVVEAARALLEKALETRDSGEVTIGGGTDK